MMGHVAVASLILAASQWLVLGPHAAPARLLHVVGPAALGLASDAGQPRGLAITGELLLIGFALAACSAYALRRSRR